MGTPSEEIWLGYNELPIVKKVTFTKRPFNNLRKRFPYLPQNGFDLMNKFLTYDPKRRITAEKALEDLYFKVSETILALKFLDLKNLPITNPEKIDGSSKIYQHLFVTPGNLQESPLPVDPSMFPTWPAKSEKMRRKSREKSPTPPIGGNYLLSQVCVLSVSVCVRKG